MNCIACNSSNLVEGSILDNGGSSKEYFKFVEVSDWKAAFGIGTRDVVAYGCVRCGNLQFIVNFTDEDKKRHLKFEGQQPDLLRRIEDEM
jgi:predicted nucleic-acid-binding Zn-ribbon protein